MGWDFPRDLGRFLLECTASQTAPPRSWPLWALQSVTEASWETCLVWSEMCSSHTCQDKDTGKQKAAARSTCSSGKGGMFRDILEPACPIIARLSLMHYHWFPQFPSEEAGKGQGCLHIGSCWPWDIRASHIPVAPITNVSPSVNTGGCHLK